MSCVNRCVKILPEGNPLFKYKFLISECQEKKGLLWLSVNLVYASKTVKTEKYESSDSLFIIISLSISFKMRSVFFEFLLRMFNFILNAGSEFFSKSIKLFLSSGNEFVLKIFVQKLCIFEE
ncbi:Protein of unknown function [Gryllus bimaculatus]|nr:Protein of unknown function [Gryllus bimaculatus]